MVYPTVRTNKLIQEDMIGQCVTQWMEESGESKAPKRYNGSWAGDIVLQPRPLRHPRALVYKAPTIV